MSHLKKKIVISDFQKWSANFLKISIKLFIKIIYQNYLPKPSTKTIYQNHISHLSKLSFKTIYVPKLSIKLSIKTIFQNYLPKLSTIVCTKTINQNYLPKPSIKTIIQN